MGAEQCPRNELIENERGMSETKSKDIWRPIDDESKYYKVRWMGDASMRRDHLVRMIRVLEDAWGG